MEEKPPLSPKQLALIETLRQDKLKRLNILQGSVRSGKTYVSLILWAFWVATKSKDSTFLMAGKTLTTLKRNVLAPLQEIMGEENFTYSLSKKEAVLFGKCVYLEGVSDVRSESKIRGMTLDGAYCDELTLFDEDFFTMLLSRLSKPDAKLIATTNPDHPRHWLKVNYLDNKDIDLLTVQFTLDDNIYLDKKYVQSLKSEYKGVYYDRFIKGLWVSAQGLIYGDFNRKCILKHNQLAQKLAENPLLFTTIGVDYGGNKSASVFCLVGFDKGFNNVYVLEEYYDSKNKSAEHLIEAFRNKVDSWRECYTRLYFASCDSAEQLLIKSFRNAVSLEVKNALKKPVNTRISMLNRLISSGRIYIAEGCVNFIDAVENAVWDSTKTTSDVRLDNGTSNIDSLDAFEYAIERFERDLFRL